jgi:hypothetical protein
MLGGSTDEALHVGFRNTVAAHRQLVGKQAAATAIRASRI